jgi:hypothetical protein
MALANTLKTDMNTAPKAVTPKPKEATKLPDASFPSAEPYKKAMEASGAAATGLAKAQEAQRTALPGVLKEYETEQAAKIKPLEEGLTFKPDMSYMRDISNVFMMVGMMGAFIGGNRSANAAANAQAALTGMMQGLVKGNDAEFQRQKTIFDENSKYLSKQVEDIKNTFKEYRQTAVEKGIAQGTSEAAQKFNEIGGQVARALTEKAGADAAEKSMGKLYELQEKHDDFVARMNQAEQAHLDSMALRRATLERGQTSSLTPEAMSMAAQEYLVTGKMPQMAWGDKASRAIILNQAASIANGLGISGYDLARIQAGFGASKSALTQMTKASAVVEGFEKTLEKNIKVAEDASDKALISAIPILNKWALTGSTAVGGTDAPKYVTALLTVADQYAKILSGGTGAAPASDTTRKQALDIIQKGFNSGQVRGVFDIIRTDSRNRLDANREIIDNLKSAMTEPFERQDHPNVTEEQYNALKPGDKYWYNGKQLTKE